jgi:hypothetical protein
LRELWVKVGLHPSTYALRATVDNLRGGLPTEARGGCWQAEAKVGAGYGDRTRLTGLGSQDITTMLSPPERLIVAVQT